MTFLCELLGWFGLFAILLAYYLLSSHKLSVDSSKYNVLNALGASGVLVNALYRNAWPIVGLEAVWALIGLYGWLKKRRG